MSEFVGGFNSRVILDRLRRRCEDSAGTTEARQGQTTPDYLFQSIAGQRNDGAGRDAHRDFRP